MKILKWPMAPSTGSLSDNDGLKIKHSLYEILGRSTTKPHFKLIQTSLNTLILLNVIVAIIETVPSLERDFKLSFYIFEVLSVGIFLFEYLARAWTCNLDPQYQTRWGRLKYLKSPFAIIDFLAVAPSLFMIFLSFDLRMLRVIRLFRLLRVLKLVRYSRALDTLHSVIVKKKPELVVTLSIGLVLLIFSSSGMYILENAAQPEKFSSIPATMWWAVATLTTIGYGDMYPITELGKLMGSIIAIIGVGLFALPAAIIASGLNEIGLIKSQLEHLGIPEPNPNCPHCSGKAFFSEKSETLSNPQELRKTG